MKKHFSVLFCLINIACFGQTKNEPAFTPQRIERTGIITLNRPIDVVFPLFGPYLEKKWAQGWNPIPVFPREEQDKEGVSFKTRSSRSANEPEFLWVVTHMDTASYLIKYYVSTPNRYWTITIRCKGVVANKSSATITYSFTGLNTVGNQNNQAAIERLFAENLKDWERAINYYLEKGEMLIHH